MQKLNYGLVLLGILYNEGDLQLLTILTVGTLEKSLHDYKHTL